MPRVKVVLEPGEDALSADVALEKALLHHSSGDAHSELFSDPAMAHAVEIAERAHAQAYADMVREIIEELDREYDGSQ